MEIKTCGDCRAFFSTESEDGGIVTFCRYNPPTVVFAGDVLLTTFPEVSENCPACLKWCEAEQG